MEKVKLIALNINSKNFSKIISQIKSDSPINAAALPLKTIKDIKELAVYEKDLILVCVNNLNKIEYTIVEKIIDHYFLLPVIVIADGEQSEKFKKLIQKGAQDCLVAKKMIQTQLNQSILYAIERKRSNNEAKIQLGNYRLYFENGPLPMWITDQNKMQFLEVNEAAIRKYGYSREEFLSMTLLDIRPLDGADKTIESYYKMKPSSYDAGYWRHKKKNDEIFYVHIYIHATEFGNKKANISFVVDVDDKIRVENKNRELSQLISEQKERLDNLLYSINDAIWSRDADTLDLIYANNAYYRLFGFKQEELEKDNGLFFKAIHPDDRGGIVEAWKDAKNTGGGEIEFRHFSANGTIKTLKARLTFKKGDGKLPDTINGVTVDVTKERELQNTIRENEQNLLATINNTNDLIWSVDKNLKIIFCNRAYQNFVAQLSGTFPKKGDYVLGEWGSETYTNNRKLDYERALRGETFTTIIEEMYEGNYLCKEFSNNPIVDHEGKIIGVNCIARDISEQRLQYMKIQEQNEKFREIAWIQSHKVRGPVASILGLTELFLIDSADAQNYEILNNLKIATASLDVIIREVVERTRILKGNKIDPQK